MQDWLAASTISASSKGDRVAMIIGNSIEFVAVIFAIARLGAISVPLNIRHQLAENRHIIEDCAAKVVAAARFIDNADAARYRV